MCPNLCAYALITIMKKSIHFVLALLFVLFCYKGKAAEVPFEGTIMVKTFSSQSKHYQKLFPFFYSGVDTCEITIKGDMVHEYFRCNQIHKIIIGNRIIYYSDLTQTGFDIPYALATGKSTRYDMNEKRTFAGMECSVIKTTILQQTGITELTGWVTDNTHNVSNKAIRTILSSFTGNYDHHYNGQLCLKSAISFSTTGQGKALVGNLEQFHSFEVISIERHEVANDEFSVPAYIKIENLEQNPMAISLLESTFDAITPKELKESGFTKEMLVDLYIYTTNEQDLLQKHHKKIKKQKKTAKNQDIVTFDIDEEWNY